MNRIESNRINFGKSFIVEIENDESQNRLIDMAATIKEKEAQSVQIIENAQAEAEKIIANAKNQAADEASVIAEKIKKEAQESGYRAGYDEGYQSGFKTGHSQAVSEVTAAIKKDFRDKISAFNEFIESIFDIKKQVIKSLHVELTQLIVNIVDMVCLRQNSIDSGIIKRLIQQAVSKLKEKDDEEVVLVVNPKMRKQISEVLDFIKLENTMISQIRLTEDASLAPDGVLVETLQERIDATFSSHLKNIINRILDESDSFSEDSMVTEYQDILGELDYKENKVTELISKQDILENNGLMREEVVIPLHEPAFIPESSFTQEEIPIETASVVVDEAVSEEVINNNETSIPDETKSHAEEDNENNEGREEIKGFTEFKELVPRLEETDSTMNSIDNITPENNDLTEQNILSDDNQDL